jgi:hypothetical protein
LIDEGNDAYPADSTQQAEQGNGDEGPTVLAINQ